VKLYLIPTVRSLANTPTADRY